MVVGRLLSGVHWLTDIIGGALLSSGLVLLYASFSRLGKGNSYRRH
jgi:undecaprenyl-diphosphatase